MDFAKEKLTYLVHYKEIRNIKQIQNSNFNTYLDSICDLNNIKKEMLNCLNKRIDIIKNIYQESELLCVNNRLRFYQCKELRQKSVKAYNERQKKYIHDIFIKNN